MHQLSRNRPADALMANPSDQPGMSPRISVVIPAKNEALNIGWVVGRLPAFVDELVLVDGRSTDATVEVTRAL